MESRDLAQRFDQWKQRFEEDVEHPVLPKEEDAFLGRHIRTSHHEDDIRVSSQHSQVRSPILNSRSSKKKAKLDGIVGDSDSNKPCFSLDSVDSTKTQAVAIHAGIQKEKIRLAAKRRRDAAKRKMHELDENLRKAEKENAELRDFIATYFAPYHSPDDENGSTNCTM
mmetsp:Transcript_6624/g.16074  ORF Transcript_6624/g.16074 Transcript_6624/m.16074 type:complete len:168 (-) Transcript_6624:103-606(-)|eukprot:CAMPEP_0174901518 /NCGR_PEP_ID=MMETSP0167-20121228/34792_1 /TAXON_ID=38298 /ORGANISM="Rhodella maculata, Strain CCMP736" /LENGTH=167 /DNA_ID=CAMNT_0016143209 /DNA_START=154 /DNA_END=657 /DNA_ORIENTATION=-